MRPNVKETFEEALITKVKTEAQKSYGSVTIDPMAVVRELLSAGKINDYDVTELRKYIQYSGIGVAPKDVLFVSDAAANHLAETRTPEQLAAWKLIHERQPKVDDRLAARNKAQQDKINANARDLIGFDINTQQPVFAPEKIATFSDGAYLVEFVDGRAVSTFKVEPKPKVGFFQRIANFFKRGSK